jgi:tight adherence protein C
MAGFIAFVTFLLLAGGITYYGYRVYARPARVYEQLREPERTRPAERAGEQSDGNGAVVRIIQQVGEKVPVSPAEAGLVRRYLIAAGFRSDNAIQVLYGTKVLLCGLLLVGGLAVSHSMAKPILRIIIPAAAACAGWFGPGFVLESLVKRRQTAVRYSLPDALDLMVVCVEAGHGLDQAFVRVAKELRLTHKDICDEFSLVTLEMRAGKRRMEALHNLADRTSEPELRKLVAIMIQADKFGTSIGDSLRTHADFMRVRRRQDAEERANKVGVKLVFPIFFCILPAMFVVTAGPAMVAIINNLLPALKQAGQIQGH